MNEVLVSIICMTYNHEKYIRDALEGFVKQKTSFKYEVIVHDDASTDGTPEIIKEYQKRYPNLIFPIIQHENQHSKRIPIYMTFIEKRVRGKYLAFCEGDDYWIDENKLQKQIDFLETNTEYIACTHNTVFLFPNGRKKIRYTTTNNFRIRFEDLLPEGGNAYHTSSLVLRKEYNNVPDCLKVRGIGDYPKALYLGMKGEIYYFADVMSVYRVMTGSSWSRKIKYDDKRKIQKNEDINKMLKTVDTMTELRYHELINRIIRLNEYKILYIQRDYKRIQKDYSDVLIRRGRREKTKLYLKSRYGFLYSAYRKLYALLNR